MMKIKDIDNNLYNLIKLYSTVKENHKILIINKLDKSSIEEELKKLNISLIKQYLKKDNITSDILRIKYIIEKEKINAVIIHNINDLTYSDISLITTVLYRSNVSELIIAKLNKEHKENLKACTILYEPYRVAGNLLILRGCKNECIKKV